MERNGENLQINFHGNKLTLALDEIKYFEGRAMRVFVTDRKSTRLNSSHSH